MYFDITVDFYDEMMVAAWTPERLDAYFRLFAERGVRRVYWIDQKEAMQYCGVPEFDANMTETRAAFGDHLRERAVAIARRIGLEIVAVVKPFDLAIPNYPSEEAEASGPIPVPGGRICQCVQWAAQHPEAMMCRRPESSGGVPAELRVVPAGGFAAGARLQLFVSSDNRNYTPSGGVVTPEPGSPAWSWRIGPEMRYYAIRLSAGEVANRLDSLIELRDAAGKRLPASLGLERKRTCRPARYHLERRYSARPGFRFDFLPNIPSSIFAGAEVGTRIWHLHEADGGAIAVTPELSCRVPGAPEPMDPAATEFWLSWLRELTDCGFDGVDVRISNHNSVLDWSAYCFHPAVLTRYRELHGMEPGTDPESMTRLRRLRGEAYTDWLTAAARLVRNAGKRFMIHIPDFALREPSESNAMEIHWDYREWLRRGIADEVTLKMILRSPEDPVWSPVRLLCDAAGIPFSECPFWHCIGDVDAYYAGLQRRGATAFNCYEAASVWCMKDDTWSELEPERAGALWRHTARTD